MCVLSKFVPTAILNSYLLEFAYIIAIIKARIIIDQTPKHCNEDCFMV